MPIVLKNAFFFIFLLSNAVLHGQNLSTDDKRARAEAQEDWANGIAKYYVCFGKGVKKKIDCSLYLEHLGLFEESYQCLSPPKGYNIQIEAILKEKHGRDMFKTLEPDAQTFYDSLNKLITRNAIFRRGEKRFWLYLNNQCTYLQIHDKSVEFPQNVKIELTFTINKRGKCKNIRITKTEDEPFNDKMFALYKGFLKHCRWLPAKTKGVRVEEEKTYEIVFNPD